MEGLIGEIKLFAGTFAPKNWMFCEGQTLEKSQYLYLAFVLGHINEATFQLPDLRDRVAIHPDGNTKLAEFRGNNTITLSENEMPAHSHNVKLGVNTDAGRSNTTTRGILSSGAGEFSGDATPNSILGGVTQETVGSATPIDIRNPYLGLRHIIYVKGQPYIDSYIGEIRLFFGKTAPENWTFCNGQILDIRPNTALFTILGTIYGGDGRKTFALPDFRGKAVLHPSENKKLGQTGGNNTTEFKLENLPTHSHKVTVGSNDDSSRQESPVNGIISGNAGPFNRDASPNSYLGGITEKVVGNNQPIQLDITNAHQGINYIICLQGSYPSRS